jgi:hypothetical protein
LSTTFSSLHADLGQGFKTASEPAQPPAAADALQPTLRCGFQAQLSRSVDMTSDVKGWEQLFYVRNIVFSFYLFIYRKSWSQ